MIYNIYRYTDKSGVWYVQRRDPKYSYPVWDDTRITISDCFNTIELLEMIKKWYNPKSVTIISDTNVQFITD